MKTCAQHKIYVLHCFSTCQVPGSRKHVLPCSSYTVLRSYILAKIISSMCHPIRFYEHSLWPEQWTSKSEPLTAQFHHGLNLEPLPICIYTHGSFQTCWALFAPQHSNCYHKEPPEGTETPIHRFMKPSFHVQQACILRPRRPPFKPFRGLFKPNHRLWRYPCPPVLTQTRSHAQLSQCAEFD